MTRYEYKVVPAPDRGIKARGVKGPEGRFAHALEVLMNDMGAEGWDYLRAETLPSEERQGLSGRTTVYRNMLVFRRPRLDEAEAYEPRLLDPPKEIPVLDAARALAEKDSRAPEGDTADAEWADAEGTVAEDDMPGEDTAENAPEAEDADQPTATEGKDAAEDQTKT
ncbi:DUF4177 domain-containing protein [Primorskyibacter aestuariivivens]|uniref:DUF4177 domain-containing protein n=1 Tax=Primorskyibacter aestuariivivens TaxID=1888912 RepID=UPI002300F367|nr:DUF4177 domain-containing protein [Primorskyibacter aestuariivivens]MDA7428669.1 DUF4177 domain-containing protein [Primorskyibacter aestuariivivens]